MAAFSAATLRQDYDARGFVTPLYACSADDAAAELREATGLAGDARFKPHLYLPAINRVARAPDVVAAARACLGGDVFLWSSDVNFKGPHSEAFFSPHQDSTYAGLAPAERCCTVWVALTAADEASGALAFAPGSHLQGQRPHVENPADPHNALSKGQRCQARGPWTHARLRPGDLSVHHFHCVHASGANRSPNPRVGLALRFARLDVRQTGAARESVTVLGQAAPEGFDVEPALPPDPSEDDLARGRAAHAAALAAERENYFPAGGAYR